MSKERELLNKATELIQIVPMMASIGKVPPDFGSELILEIQELLAQPEEESVHQKLLKLEDGIEVEILPSELWQDGYETGKRTMQPEQEQKPVAWRWKKTSGWAYQDNNNNGGEPLYTSPPIEKSISKQDPLSDSRVIQNYTESTGYGLYLEGWKSKMLDFARAIEKAHGIGAE